MEQRVLTRRGKYFPVGSNDWNDAAFTGQRVRWTRLTKKYIEVSQDKAIDELEEIPVERNTKEDLHCTASMHTMYRSLLGQINLLQSRTQFQCCYKFSRCASMTASPTAGYVKSLNKLARQIKSQPVKLHYWPLTRPLRILGFPDASYRNNDNGSSQRDSVLGRIARPIFKGWSPIDYKSQKTKKDCAVHYRGGAVFLLWFVSVSPNPVKLQTLT